ncbi:MAG TPA: hypothetical protein VG694_01525 [Candidatus Paceibacterota bacterium]|jgi:cell division septal protein FtsQ|nr:hypothetical protein [Candidatus Paceibacterota bacterium]
MKKRSVLNSPRLKEIKKKRNAVVRRKIFFWALGIAALLAGLVFLSRWGELNIENISIAGSKVVDAKEIQGVVRADLIGKYLFLFPKTNVAVYPKKKIEADLKAKFKRLEDIKLEIGELKTLDIKVTEREPAYIWCGENLPDSDTEEDCYFSDENGYVFDVAPYFSGDVYFKLYGPLSGSNPEGSEFLPDSFSHIIYFKDAITKLGLAPVALLADPGGDADIYLSSAGPVAQAPKIIFNPSADVEKLAENLQAALGTEPLHTDFDKKYSSLQYLDMRFGDKVYYKFTGGN